MTCFLIGCCDWQLSVTVDDSSCSTDPLSPDQDQNQNQDETTSSERFTKHMRNNGS